MRITTTIIAVLTGLLSMAAGAAKVMLVPEEAEFLAQFGFADLATMIYGIVQVLGGCLLLLPFTRLYGAVGAGAGFGMSVVLILVAGDLSFAAVSLVPVAFCGFVVFRCLQAPAIAPGEDV